MRWAAASGFKHGDQDLASASAVECNWGRDGHLKNIEGASGGVMYVLDSSGEENDAVGPVWTKSANVAEGRRWGVVTYQEL